MVLANKATSQSPYSSWSSLSAGHVVGSRTEAARIKSSSGNRLLRLSNKDWRNFFRARSKFYRSKYYTLRTHAQGYCVPLRPVYLYVRPIRIWRNFKPFATRYSIGLMIIFAVPLRHSPYVGVRDWFVGRRSVMRERICTLPCKVTKLSNSLIQ